MKFALILTIIAWVLVIVAQLFSFLTSKNPSETKDKIVIWCYGIAFALFITGIIYYATLPSNIQ